MSGWHRHGPGAVYNYAADECPVVECVGADVIVVDPADPMVRDAIAKALLSVDRDKAWGQTKTPNGKYLKAADAVLARLTTTEETP